MSAVYQNCLEHMGHQKSMDYAILERYDNDVGIDLVCISYAYYLLLSDLTMKMIIKNFFSHILHTYTYTMLQEIHLHSSNEEKSQNK